MRLSLLLSTGVVFVLDDDVHVPISRRVPQRAVKKIEFSSGGPSFGAHCDAHSPGVCESYFIHPAKGEEMHPQAEQIELFKPEVEFNSAGSFALE